MIENEKNWLAKASEKLHTGKITGRREQIMAGPVREALLEFATQDEDFAKAIAQGGTFQECMAAVAKGVNTSISDLEAYKKAAKFYFPGARIGFQMSIDTGGDTKATEKDEPIQPKILDLSDFFPGF